MTENINELIKKLDNWATSWESSEELQKIGSAAVEPLAKAMEEQGDEHIGIGIYAAITLGNIGDVRAVGPLIRTLRHNKSWEVRRRAAWALGKIRDRSAIPMLLDSLSNDPNPDVRSFSATALGKIGDLSTVKALKNVLDDLEITDDYSPVCFAAITALGDIGGPEAKKALVDIERDGIPSNLVYPVPTIIAAISGSKKTYSYSDTAKLLAASALKDMRNQDPNSLIVFIRKLFNRYD